MQPRQFNKYCYYMVHGYIIIFYFFVYSKVWIVNQTQH